MKRSQIFALLCLLWFLILPAKVEAQQIAIDNGITYLYANQSPDGSWLVNETTDYYATAEVLTTLGYLGKKETNYTNGLNWFTLQSADNNDYLARRIMLLNSTADLNTLLSYRNQDGGWGTYPDYVNSTIIDTSLSLLALKSANYSDQTVINNATSYLISNQNTDGGFGFYSGDTSNVYMTALVSWMLQQFPQTTSIATTINKATSYLIAHQNTDGGFGSSPSTVYGTAHAYIALISVSTDATVLGNAINYLTSTQLPNGSWNDDPYSTALAIRALYFSQNKPTPPPPAPTTGTVTGKVVDATTNQPLNAVSVVSGQLSTTTTNTGEFTLSNIPQGSQQISFSLSGYAASTVTVNITAGSIINIGTIGLSVNPTTGIVQGIVTDASNGQPLSGAAITVTGQATWTAVTSIDGSYRITDITPGSVTVSATKTGYYTVSGTGTVTAGSTLIFSPSLSTTPPTATTGDLKGTVIDGSTGLSIKGASIAIAPNPLGINPNATTDISGAFSILSIPPGSYTVTITASGYTGQSYTVTILAGVATDLGIVNLNPQPTVTTIKGKVTDASTGSPIAYADVSIQGTNLSTKTSSDGTYKLSGITQLDFTVRVSAAGYDSLVHIISLISHGAYTIDFPLTPSHGDLRIVSLTTDTQHYSAYASISILAEVFNSSSLPLSGTVSVSILDAEGEVINNLQATVIDADGVVQSSFNFQLGASTSIAIPWETGNYPPGTYHIIAKVIEGEAGVGFGAVVAAERMTDFVIDPTQAIASLVLTPLPRFTNLGAVEQISIQANIVNRSNVATELNIAYTWRSPSGIALHNGTGAISLLPAEGSKSVLLESFPFTFAESGEHPIYVQIVTGPTPTSLIGEFISVAPGIRIEPSQNLTPATVVPDGDKRIRIDIQLKGVEQK